MNTIEALQGLYKKLGGDAEDVAELTTIPEMVDAITSQVNSGGGGGGSDLPEVTAADNGVNLSVVNGAWKKNTPFVAMYTKADDDAWVCDKTLAEYKAAYNAGRAVRAKIVFPADEEEQKPEVTSEVFLSCVELQDVDNGFIGGVAMYFGAYSSISHYSESGTEEISITI